MKFNDKARSVNAALASASGIIQQIAAILGNFIYRTVFLQILSKEYLGITGLFSNILQLFSLAELGIGSAIVYSMYKPFAEHNVNKIGTLIRFYKKVYFAIASFIAVFGVCVYPFLSFFVDPSEIPSDVNVTVVYFLFVFQSVVSYLFVFKQSLLTADQRNHIVSLYTAVLTLLSYAVRIVALLLSRDFAMMLLCDVILVLLANFLFSVWITGRYREVFLVKEDISKEERHKIFKDTGGLLCHKIGTVVVSSTDNIVLSKYVGLATVGIYSNYSTIILAVTNLASRVFGNLLPSVANYVIKNSKEACYTLFRRMLYGNMWISSFTTVCLYLLLNPFIELWLDESFLLSQPVVACICVQHYMQVSRLTANNFVNACGYFMLDRIRPLIESVINLSISVVLAMHIGILGVFIGTVVSGALTYFWREPYLVFKKFFCENMISYWKTHLFWLLLTALMCCGGGLLFSRFSSTLLSFVLEVFLAVVLSNFVIILVTFRTDEFRYFFQLIKKKLHFV